MGKERDSPQCPSENVATLKPGTRKPPGRVDNSRARPGRGGYQSGFGTSSSISRSGTCPQSSRIACSDTWIWLWRPCEHCSPGALVEKSADGNYLVGTIAVKSRSLGRLLACSAYSCKPHANCGGPCPNSRKGNRTGLATNKIATPPSVLKADTASHKIPSSRLRPA
jgi:hypothetical protein